MGSEAGWNHPHEQQVKILWVCLQEVNLGTGPENPWVLCVGAPSPPAPRNLILSASLLRSDSILAGSGGEKKKPTETQNWGWGCLGGHWCSARLEVWPPHKPTPPGVRPAELWMARALLPCLSLPWPWVQGSALGVSEQEGGVRALHAVIEGWRQLCEEDS